MGIFVLVGKNVEHAAVSVVCGFMCGSG